jgi:phage baseplate assembly protein W
MEKKFLGCPYPIIKTPNGLLPSQFGVNQIKADLLQLLLTNPGERVMLPEYGTPLRRLVFEPNDRGLANKARNMIIDSINKWEPRIAVQQIEVQAPINDKTSLNADDALDDLEHILLIKILFVDPEDIKEVNELKLELPLGSGA